MNQGDSNNHQDEVERFQVLQQLEDWLEGPVVFLGLVWLVLLIVELTTGLNPLLEALSLAIWAVFLLDFAIRLLLAPHKVAFLRQNWLTAISLLVPALRVLRITRLARLFRLTSATRGVRLVKVIGSINRGMNALRNSLNKRGLGYVVGLSIAVTLAGAAGLFAFEQSASGDFGSYGDALWHTAMIMTTLGPQAQPVTPEGRLLTVLLALYAFAVFGYVTASLATFFIGQDAHHDPAGQQDLNSLREENRTLRAQLDRLHQNRSEDRI